jgi:hypothetical protein
MPGPHPRLNTIYDMIFKLVWFYCSVKIKNHYSRFELLEEQVTNKW